jgi:Flp pilus assembly protein TadD
MPQNPSSHDTALAQALADHRAGRSAAAESAYRGLLAANPRFAGASHHLGVLLVQTGRAAEGLGRIKAALEIDPAEPLYYFSLAKAQLASGDPAQAGASLRQAAQLGLTDARFDLLKAQIWDAAAAKYRQALQARPGDAVLLDNLGTALLEQGHADQAIACYRDALAQNPDFAEAHFHLGAALSQNGHVAEGFAHYMRRAALVYGKASPLSGDAPPHKRKHDLAQRDYLWGGKAPADAPQVAEMFQIAEGERIAGPALNPASPHMLELTYAGMRDWSRSITACSSCANSSRKSPI